MLTEEGHAIEKTFLKEKLDWKQVSNYDLANRSDILET